MPATAIAEIIRVYLEHGRATLARESFEKTALVLRSLVTHLNGKTLNECRAFDLLEWVNRHHQWRSDWTRKRHLLIAKRPFNWAAQVGLIPSHPFQAATWTAGNQGQPMPEESFQGLLRQSPPQFRRVLLFLRYTGCRPGELMRLSWPDYDHDRQCFVLSRHKTAKKTGKPRTIPLHPVCQKLVSWLHRRQRYKPSEAVFLNGCGIRWDKQSLYQRFKSVRKRAGLPKTVKLYGLRHAFGTKAVRSGVNLKLIAECMGHARTSTTEYYVHLAGDTDCLIKAVREMFK